MSKAITSPVIQINNETIYIVAGSGTFDEGLGEQKIDPQSSGNRVEAVFSDDLSTHIGKVKFDLKPTADNIEKARAWKILKNDNGIVINGDDSHVRTFTNMALINSYEVTYSPDGNISLEFNGDPAI